MTPLERELLRLYVEAEQSDDPRQTFNWLVCEDVVVMDMLWEMCRVG